MHANRVRLTPALAIVIALVIAFIAGHPY